MWLDCLPDQHLCRQSDLFIHLCFFFFFFFFFFSFDHISLSICTISQIFFPLCFFLDQNLSSLIKYFFFLGGGGGVGFFSLLFLLSDQPEQISAGSVDRKKCAAVKTNDHVFNVNHRSKIFPLKTHFSAYMRRVAFIITSNKHALSLFLTSKDSLI